MNPRRGLPLLLLVTLLASQASRAQQAEPAAAAAPPEREARHPERVGLVFVGAAVGGALGAVTGKVVDLSRCMLWCGEPKPRSYVPLAALTGAGLGALLGVIAAYPPAGSGEPAERRSVTPLLRLAPREAGVGLTGRF